MEETHVYTVAPRKPIRGLVKGKIITKPMNLNLTKDEVIFCMKHGPVYRKFYLDESERVTPSNLDRLHRSEHLTEAQYKALCEKQAAEEETKAEVVEEEAPVKETKKTSKKKAKEVKVEPEVSEVVEEEPTEEEVAEESKKVEEEQSSTENDSTSIDVDLLSNPVDVVPKKKSSSKSRKKKKSSTAKTEEVVDAAEATQEDS